MRRAFRQFSVSKGLHQFLPRRKMKKWSPLEPRPIYRGGAMHHHVGSWRAFMQAGGYAQGGPWWALRDGGKANLRTGVEASEATKPFEGRDFSRTIPGFHPKTALRMGTRQPVLWSGAGDARLRPGGTTAGRVQVARVVDADCRWVVRKSRHLSPFRSRFEGTAGDFFLDPHY